MSFRDHRVLYVIGYTLSGLAVASFCLNVIFKVWSGHPLDTYHSVTLVQWTYGGALIVLVLAASMTAVGGCLRLLAWYRRR